MTRLWLIALIAFAFEFHATAAEPVASPPDDPHTRMEQEVATIRTALTLNRMNPQAGTPSPAIFEDLIKRYPAEAEPHALFGEYLKDTGQNEAAFRQWQSALELDSKRDDILAAEADLLLQTGQIVEAADALERAAALAPKNASYLYSLAHIYSMLRRDLMTSRHASETALITRGTDYFRRAAELAPDNLAYAQAYAEAFYTQPQPDWKLARAAWEALLERSPEKDFIRGHLIRVNIRLGDKAEARKHLAALKNPAFAKMKASLQRQIDRL